MRQRYSPIIPSINIIRPNKKVITAIKVVNPWTGIFPKIESMIVYDPYKKLIQAVIKPTNEMNLMGAYENAMNESKKSFIFLDKVHFDFP
jgi:hypothetical protein